MEMYRISVPSCLRSAPAEQPVQLLLREDGRGLVQDQDPRAHGDRLGDLDHLLMRDAQLPDHLVHVDAHEADRGEDFVGPR